MSLVLNATITAVTVYRNGALVTRAGSLPALEAPAVLHIPGMPLLFASDSLRIRVSGGSADAVEELAELAGEEGEDPADRATLIALDAERGRLSRRRAAWQARRTTAEKISIKAVKRDDEPVPPSVGLWLAVEALIGEEQDRCATAVEAIDARIEEIAEEIEAIRRRQQSGRSARYTRTLATTLTPDGAGEIRVEVDCFIPGARWAPVYRVYVDTAARRVRLWMGARVAQATGEDWSGVPIAVSTADLTRSARIPTLSSWRIGRALAKPSRWRPLPEGLDGLFADYDAAPRSPSPPPPPAKPRAPQPPPEPPAYTASSRDEPTGAPGGAGGSRPIPPPSMAMPVGAPMPAAPMPMPAARSRGFGGVAMKRSRSMSREEVAAESFAMAVADEEGGMDDGVMMPPETGELEPGRLLDYAWLRLAPPSDRRRRGKLLGVDIDAEYQAFIEERDGDLTRYQAFSSALSALRQEQSRLWQIGLPSGCFDVRQASFHHRYPAGPAVDLPADGRFHQIAILEAEADCELLLRCVPRQDPQAYRYARLANPLARPLLPGPIQVYLDGAYTVTGRLTQVGPRGELRLNLGIEEQVRVARTADFHQSERGMLTSTSSLEHRVHTEIRSRLSAPVAVEIFERLPLSAGVEGVELSLDEASPRPETGVDPDGSEADGALCWRLSLAAGGGADIRYQYTISISARKELIGGNRREP
jgi:hypothetical protein